MWYLRLCFYTLEGVLSQLEWLGTSGVEFSLRGFTETLKTIQLWNYFSFCDWG